jgi:hypothetical protein
MRTVIRTLEVEPKAAAMQLDEGIDLVWSYYLERAPRPTDTKV